MRGEFVSDDEKEMVTGFVVFGGLLEFFEDELGSLMKFKIEEVLKPKVQS
jgi:hypothetical protein